MRRRLHQSRRPTNRPPRRLRLPRLDKFRRETRALTALWKRPYIGHGLVSTDVHDRDRALNQLAAAIAPSVPDVGAVLDAGERYLPADQIQAVTR